MTKEERKLAMPISSQFVQEIREAFMLDGVDQIVKIKASENGHEIEWQKEGA